MYGIQHHEPEHETTRAFPRPAHEAIIQVFVQVLRQDQAAPDQVAPLILPEVHQDQVVVDVVYLVVAVEDDKILKIYEKDNLTFSGCVFNAHKSSSANF